MSHHIIKLFTFIVLFTLLINDSVQRRHLRRSRREESPSLYSILFNIFDHLDKNHKARIPTHKIFLVLTEADIPFDDDVLRDVVNGVRTKTYGVVEFADVVKVAKTIIEKFDKGMTKELGNDYLMLDKGDKGYIGMSELAEMFFDVYPDADEKDIDGVIHEIFNKNCKSDKCTGFMSALRGD